MTEKTETKQAKKPGLPLKGLLMDKGMSRLVELNAEKDRLTEEMHRLCDRFNELGTSLISLQFNVARVRWRERKHSYGHDEEGNPIRQVSSSRRAYISDLETERGQLFIKQARDMDPKLLEQVLIFDTVRQAINAEYEAIDRQIIAFEKLQGALMEISMQHSEGMIERAISLCHEIDI